MGQVGIEKIGVKMLQDVLLDLQRERLRAFTQLKADFKVIKKRFNLLVCPFVFPLIDVDIVRALRIKHRTNELVIWGDQFLDGRLG
jgi:hypothetical protein